MPAGKWVAFQNWIAGERFWRVGRVIDTDQPVHSGNIEYAGEYIRDEEACRDMARKLNEEAEQNGR